MAVTIRHVRPITDDEILELSRQNPGYQFERTAGGELVVAATGSEAGRRSGEVFGQLYAWNLRTGSGVAFDSSTGFRLPDGALWSPDASWVRRDRWQALAPQERRGFAPLCPDVVFEVRSESDALRDLQAKMLGYVANGARLGVLVDPQDRILEVYRPGHETERLRTPGSVALNPELPEFVLNTEPIFRE